MAARDDGPVRAGRPQRTRYDAIVVGAGHNGLVTAAYLARAGWRVLVLERRDVVGGTCVTEETWPGFKVSTAAYVNSLLRPEIIRDLRLAEHGLRMVSCEPALQVPFPDGNVLAWWPDPERTAADLRRVSVRDAAAFLRFDAELKRLARYLEPFFLEPPPDIDGGGLERLAELIRVGRRFRGITGSELAGMVALLTGSLADVLDRHFDNDRVKTLCVANSLYGKHGGPSYPGSALGLLFHLLSGGDEGRQGFHGHVIGGMGAITQAMAAAAAGFGAEIRAGAPVGVVDVAGGRARGVVLADGSEIRARVVLSNADPKRTFLQLVPAAALPETFRRRIAGIRMDGPCAKVNLVLGEEPRVRGLPEGGHPGRRALFTLLPSADFADRSYEAARRGEIPEELWIDCVVASNVDPTLAPAGRHVMTCFVQYVPYRLRTGTWEEAREPLGDRVVRRIAEYAPNVAGAVCARQVLTPLDLERIYGLTEGNIFHGDLALDQLFFMRPVAGFARYRSPVDGLYLCGAGAHPGGGVTGAPGHNAAKQVLRDLKTRRL